MGELDSGPAAETSAVAARMATGLAPSNRFVSTLRTGSSNHLKEAIDTEIDTVIAMETASHQGKVGGSQRLQRAMIM